MFPKRGGGRPSFYECPDNFSVSKYGSPIQSMSVQIKHKDFFLSPGVDGGRGGGTARGTRNEGFIFRHDYWFLKHLAEPSVNSSNWKKLKRGCYNWCHKKGTWSVHTFIYLSLVHTGSWGTFFMKYPVHYAFLE